MVSFQCSWKSLRTQVCVGQCKADGRSGDFEGGAKSTFLPCHFNTLLFPHNPYSHFLPAEEEEYLEEGVRGAGRGLGTLPVFGFPFQVAPSSLPFLDICQKLRLLESGSPSLRGGGGGGGGGWWLGGWLVGWLVGFGCFFYPRQHHFWLFTSHPKRPHVFLCRSREPWAELGQDSVC